MQRKSRKARVQSVMVMNYGKRYFSSARNVKSRFNTKVPLEKARWTGQSFKHVTCTVVQEDIENGQHCRNGFNGSSETASSTHSWLRAAHTFVCLVDRVGGSWGKIALMIFCKREIV